MGENEAELVRTLTAGLPKNHGELIQQHRGRVIDSPGDNILAEFGSVVDAVQCSVAAQNEFKARNAELSENRRMEFRIGVNLGDVIERENAHIRGWSEYRRRDWSLWPILVYLHLQDCL